MVMNNIAMITGTLFGILGVILGAFGAHALKKILSEDKLASFEIGVKYQMYTAFFLLILGNLGDFGTSLVVWSYYLATIGTILFSFSIYLLSLANYLKRNFRFLGPITPLGGLFMILGWSCLLISLF